MARPTVRSIWTDPTALLGVVAVLIWVVWGAVDGGFFASGWGLLGAVLVLALALTIAFEPPRLDRLRAWMMLALLGFVAWNFLSLLWAEFPGEAWIGADKTLLYAASFAVFALWPSSADRLQAVLALFAGGVAIVAGLTLLQAATTDDPDSLLVDGRLGGPVEYVNASVGLWMLAFWPAIYLASSRHVAPLARGAYLGIAVLLLGLTILGQSRGWLFLLPVVVPVFLLLSRQRLRAVLALALAAAPFPLVLPWLLDVSARAEEGADVRPTLQVAALAIATAAVAMGAAMVAIAVLDRRVTLSRRAHQMAAVAVAVTGVLAAMVGTAVVAQHVDERNDWLAARWHEFTTGAYPEGPDRLTGSLGTNRYAEWKVALGEFRDHPLAGIGADNYAAAYLRHRPTAFFHPRYPHSTPLRLLSQLGLIGTALFSITAGIAGWLALRRRRSLDAVRGGAVGAALMVFAYWLLHGSIDWFWEIPALAAPALGFLALASAHDHAAEAPEASETPGFVRLRSLLVGGAALAAAAVLITPWLAGTYQEAAIAVWRERPAIAYARLDRAARINRLSAEPLVVGGVIAVRRGEFGRAELFFERAQAREPANWFVYRQLGLLAARDGESERGRRLLERALRLNPLEPSLRQALATVRNGRRVTEAVLNVEPEEKT